MLNINWSIIYTIVNIIILFIVLKLFLFKPVQRIIEKRQDMINDSMQKAEDTKAEAEVLRDSYSEKLRNAHAEAEEIIRDAKLNAGAQRDIIIDKAKADAESIIKGAKKQADLDKEKKMSEVKSELAEVAIAAARKAMESGDVSQNSIEGFLNQVGEQDE